MFFLDLVITLRKFEKNNLRKKIAAAQLFKILQINIYMISVSHLNWISSFWPWSLFRIHRFSLIYSTHETGVKSHMCTSVGTTQFNETKRDTKKKNKLIDEKERKRYTHAICITETTMKKNHIQADKVCISTQWIMGIAHNIFWLLFSRLKLYFCIA